MSLQRYKGRNRRISMTAALGASLLVSGLVAQAQRSTTRGEETGASEVLLKNIHLSAAPLNQALSLILQSAHIDIVIKPGNYNRVYIETSNPKPVSEVLKLITDSANADLWQESGVYFVGPKGSAPQPIAPAPVALNNTPEPTGVRPVKYEKFYLKYTPPHRMLRMLGLAGFNSLDANDQYELAANRMFVEALNPVHSYTLNSNEGIRFQGNNPSTAPSAPQVPAAPSVGPAAPTSNSNGSGPSTSNGSPNGDDQGAHRAGNDAQNFGRGQGALGAPGGFGQGAGFGQGGAPGQGQQPTGAGQAAGFLQGISPQDIYALDADNSLVLRYDDPQQILNLQEVLRVLDVKPRQIQIKAEFVTVTQNDVSSFGVNFNFTKVNLLAGANLGYQQTNTAYIQYATGNLQTQLSFILTQGRGKVVASPLATTLNGVAAQFQSTQLIPVLISSSVITNNGPAATTSQIVQIPVQVQLQVIPRINGDDSITLQGIVTFSDVTGTITNPAGGTIPITITQPVVINRIVRNGDSMVLAGLTRKRDNVSTNKVPLLGDLPLIGTLFRSRNVTTDDSELVVFITPSIIPERPSNTGGAVGGGLGNPGAPGGLPTVGGGTGLMP